MFKNPTVFILGAGASWHYGYPTGEELVKKVIQKAGIARNYFKVSADCTNVQRPDYIARDALQNTGSSIAELKTQWRRAVEESNSLITRLRQVDPLVIDYFLGQNPQLRPIGKLLIAWVLLECEKTNQAGNVNRQELLENSPYFDEKQRAKTLDITKFQDNWYRFVIHKLIANCVNSKDLLKNKVHVTFNYDVSLEQALHQGLSSIEQLDAPDVGEFFKADRVVHMYGKIREMAAVKIPSFDWNEAIRNIRDGGSQSRCKEFLDITYAASKGLRVIDPADKESDEHAITVAKKLIKEATCVYILGYGFDENNNKRLGLS